MNKEQLINEISKLYNKDSELREYRRLLHLIVREGNAEHLLSEIKGVLSKYGDVE